MVVFNLGVHQDHVGGNRDDVGVPVTNVGNVGFLDRVDQFMDYHRLDSKDFMYHTHSFGVLVMHGRAHCGGGLIQDV